MRQTRQMERQKDRLERARDLTGAGEAFCPFSKSTGIEGSPRGHEEQASGL